eukprot:8902237-Heterocapsa_arctica.AAC.1
MICVVTTEWKAEVKWRTYIFFSSAERQKHHEQNNEAKKDREDNRHKCRHHVSLMTEAHIMSRTRIRNSLTA